MIKKSPFGRKKVPMKKFLIYVSALSLLGSLPVSANDETEETWAVYWYLCGSDLESQYGCATGGLSPGKCHRCR